MDELRFVRRDEQTLIVADETGTEYRLIVDDAALSELRHLHRRDPSAPRIRPREIQAQIRAGKSLEQVAQLMGLESEDIERYAEPVLAERSFILERAHAVSVRTEANADQQQLFGEVIAERLRTLQAEIGEWSSWRDDNEGWMIGLDFVTEDVSHRAVWSYDHRKNVLAAVTSDAVTLSQQGNVGDRLIPKLRAVTPSSESSSAAADPTDDAETNIESRTQVPQDERADDAIQARKPSDEREFQRKLDIEQLAVKTVEDEPVDLSQTADLLDALRKRRGEREQASRGTAAPVSAAPAESSGNESSHDPADAATGITPRAGIASIWASARVSADGSHDRPAPATPVDQLDLPESGEAQEPADSGSAASDARSDAQAEGKQGRKGRASIPKWEDILFGTRSEEDPAQ